MESICAKCSSRLLRSNICHKCTQSSATTSAPRKILRRLSSSKINSKESHQAQLPPTDKSDKPQNLNKVFVRENKTPPRITERRLRIFHNDHDDTEDESPQSKSSKNSLKLQLLSSSSTTDQCLYQSGPFSLSDTILEEHWTESSLTSISLLRITSSTFVKPPFLDPSSYGQDITKLSFEGPCCPKTIHKALKYFPGITSLEFSPGFFVHEDYDNDELISRAPALLEVLQEIKSLTVTCDSKKYFELGDIQQHQMSLRILSLLNVLSGGLKALEYCSLSLPIKYDMDSYLNTFIIANNAKYYESSRGIKRVDWANKQIRYTVDLSSEESHSSSPTKVAANNNRKRKAESPPPSPEVEIIKMVAREDKIQHVSLSDDDEQESNKENDNDGLVSEHLPEDLTSLNKGHLNVMMVLSSVPSAAAIPTLAQATQSQQQPQFLHAYGEQVIVRLGQLSWREAHPGEWGRFDCTSIRIGDYAVGRCGSVSSSGSYAGLDMMIFADCGIYFRFLHCTQKKVIRIGIPIQEITEVRLFTSTSHKSTIFLKTSERFTVWIRDTLGMSKSEERQGFYSPRSKYPCQRFIQFQTGHHLAETLDLFQRLYASANLQQIVGVRKMLLLRSSCLHG